ncbi:MAG: hypothetical protein ACPGYV_12585 [Phycisphaeraceae bacterium]
MNGVLGFLMLAALASFAVLVLMLKIVFYYSGRYADALSGLICPRCEYKRLGATSKQCPECGAEWGVGQRQRTPAWVEWSFVLIFLLTMFLILPGLLLVALGLLA